MSSGPDPSWRDLLARAITIPTERAALARRIGVSSRTLSRWAAGGQLPTQPSDRLQRLVEALPQHREALITSITAEYPDFAMSATAIARYTIPASDYRTIMARAALIPDVLRFSVCARALAESMVAQLDPGTHGIHIAVCSCTPPDAGGYVRGLVAQTLARTAPWQPLSEEAEAYSVGSETLEGYVAMAGVLHYIGETGDYGGPLPYQERAHVGSICAVPIRRAARIAGVLSVASSQAGYFGEQARRDLVEEYAYLAMLLYEDGQFYDPEWIMLDTQHE